MTTLNGTPHRISNYMHMVPDHIPVALMFVGAPCDLEEHPTEKDLRQKIEAYERDIHFIAVCIPEEYMPVPRPALPCVYYFVDRNQLNTSFYRTNPVYTFEADMDVLFSMVDDALSYDQAYYGDQLGLVQATNAMFLEEQKTPHKYPPLFKQARGLAKVIWESGRRAAKHLPVIAPAEVAYERSVICSVCDKNDNGRCSACGCHINTKNQLAASECPLGKWSPHKY